MPGHLNTINHQNTPSVSWQQGVSLYLVQTDTIVLRVTTFISVQNVLQLYLFHVYLRMCTWEVKWILNNYNCLDIFTNILSIWVYKEYLAKESNFTKSMLYVPFSLAYSILIDFSFFRTCFHLFCHLLTTAVKLSN